MNSIDEIVHDGTWNIDNVPLLWARFRDDIYIPWTYGSAALETFHEWLNGLLPGIKFTMCSSKQGIEFLNTFIYDKGGKLQTKPYSKPCDDHTYLVTSSCHPTHNLRNIPFGIIQGLYKIASEPAEYEKSKAEYSGYLVERGYSNEVIQEAFCKAEQRDRESYFCIRSDLDVCTDLGVQRVFPLVCDYNPALPNVSSILAKHKHILSLDSDPPRVALVWASELYPHVLID